METYSNNNLLNFVSSIQVEYLRNNLKKKGNFQKRVKINVLSVKKVL